MPFFVLEYCGVQLQTTSKPTILGRRNKKVVLLEDGTIVDFGTRTSDAPDKARFVRPSDPGYVPVPQGRIGTGIIFVELANDCSRMTVTNGPTQHNRWAGWAVSIADPTENRGVMIGNGNSQTNDFTSKSKPTPDPNFLGIFDEEF